MTVGGGRDRAVARDRGARDGLTGQRQRRRRRRGRRGSSPGEAVARDQARGHNLPRREPTRRLRRRGGDRHDRRSSQPDSRAAPQHRPDRRPPRRPRDRQRHAMPALPHQVRSDPLQAAHKHERARRAELPRDAPLHPSLTPRLSTVKQQQRRGRHRATAAPANRPFHARTTGTSQPSRSDAANAAGAPSPAPPTATFVATASCSASSQARAACTDRTAASGSLNVAATCTVRTPTPRRCSAQAAAAACDRSAGQLVASTIHPVGDAGAASRARTATPPTTNATSRAGTTGVSANPPPSFKDPSRRPDIRRLTPDEPTTIAPHRLIAPTHPTVTNRSPEATTQVPDL